MKIPTSEAAVERVFSRHKLIHTAQRARLAPGFVEKVLFVRYNAKRFYPKLPIWASDDQQEVFETDILIAELFGEI